MTSLKTILAQSERTDVIRDTVHLIDDEVSRKSGVSGFALKGGYKVVKKLKNGRMISDAVDHLLDPFADALDPLYREYRDQSQAGSFEDFLASRRSRAANDLLSITDERVNQADNRIIISTYQKLRGQAEKHVQEAVPGVGRLIDRYAPRGA